MDEAPAVFKSTGNSIELTAGENWSNKDATQSYLPSNGQPHTLNEE